MGRIWHVTLTAGPQAGEFADPVLSNAQAAGRACIACGRDSGPMIPVGWVHSTPGDALEARRGIRAFAHSDCRLKTVVDPLAGPLGGTPDIEARLMREVFDQRRRPRE